MINPGATGAADYELPALSKEIRQITERAVLLVLARSATDEDFSSRPPAEGKDAQVEASYDKLSAASDAMKQYFELDKPDKRAELERLVGKLTTLDPDKRSADDWAKAIVNDRKAIKADAKAKKWSDPQQGFMNLDKRLVKAMTSSTGANLARRRHDRSGPRHHALRHARPRADQEGLELRPEVCDLPHARLSRVALSLAQVLVRLHGIGR